MQIEADTRLKDTKLEPKEVARVASDVTSAWYDQSRARLADAIVSLRHSVGE